MPWVGVAKTSGTDSSTFTIAAIDGSTSGTELIGILCSAAAGTITPPTVGGTWTLVGSEVSSYGTETWHLYIYARTLTGATGATEDWTTGNSTRYCVIRMLWAEAYDVALDGTLYETSKTSWPYYADEMDIATTSANVTTAGLQVAFFIGMEDAGYPNFFGFNIEDVEDDQDSSSSRTDSDRMFLAVFRYDSSDAAAHTLRWSNLEFT